MYGVIFLQIFVNTVSPCNKLTKQVHTRALFRVPNFTKILIEMTSNVGTAEEKVQLTTKAINNQFHFRSWL